MRLKHLLLAVGCVLAVAGAWVLVRPDVAKKAPAESVPQRKIQKRPSVIPYARPRTNAVRRVSEPDDGMSPSDRKLCQGIQEASDCEDRAALRKFLSEAKKSANPEVRKSMVEALGWFGKDMIADMTTFLLDPDEDVREIVKNNWQIAVSEIEDEEIRAGIVEQTLLTVSDEGLSEMLAAELNGIDEKLAVNTISKIVMSGRPAGVKAAKEAYLFVTGEEWTTAAAAREWLKENYTPPEKD